jgi:hypothetical protein
MSPTWNSKEKAKLMACVSRDDIARAFPGQNIKTLVNRRAIYRAQQRLLTENGVEVAEEPTAPESAPGERSVPLATHLRALRQLDEVKRKHSDYVETLYTAVSDAMTTFSIGQVPEPKLKKGNNSEVCVPLLSDLQLSKTTKDYNSKVAEERLYEYARKIVKLTEIQRSDHPITKCHVMALGDLIEGENIFSGQAFLLDAGLYRQICVDGPRMITGFLRYLLEHFEKVECTWVIGNHGRIGRRGEFDPETNGDRMLGKIVQMAMSGEPRFTMTVPDGRGDRNWYAVVEEGDWKALLFHGDQMRGHSGLPFYAFHKAISGWASGALPYPDNEFQTALCGHFHQAARLPINKREVYINGSLESMNTFASEQLKAMSDPQQWLLFVSPDRGRVTASYVVDLT